MPLPPEDKRPPMVVAMEWVSRITTISLMMVVPAGLGYWLDSWLGTGPWQLIAGAGFGLFIGLQQVLQMTSGGSRGNRPRRREGDR